MPNKTYIGVSSVARPVNAIYVGVSNVARKVLKAYVGVSGVARLAYIGVVDMWKNGVDLNGFTGGWNGTYVHHWNQSTGHWSDLYSMINMNKSGDYLAAYMSVGGTGNEKAMYVRSVKAINVTQYKSLKIDFDYSLSTKHSGGDIYFGLLNTAYTAASSDTFADRCLVSTRFTPSAAVTNENKVFTLNLSSVTGSGYVLFLKAANSDATGAQSCRIRRIWME